MNIDKPLDDIIASKKQNRGPRRSAPAGGKAPAAAQAAKAAPAAPKPANPLNSIVSDKILVSNLPEDVTEPQIKELFTSTVGPLKFASLSYDSKGKSKGIATIQFHKNADALKAYEQYNKRLVDGKRPMKVEIVYDPTRLPPPPLTSRLGAAPAQSSTIAAAGGSARQPRAANAGGKKGGRGPRSEPRPKATVESLDAEMSDYLAQGQKTE
ncbi:RNA-binding domain-containing protein [Meredithblackwellia eburnea MCA 4105]